MKLRPLLAIALLFLGAACAKQAPEGAAPANMLAEPPAPEVAPAPSEPVGSGGTAVCTSPECEGACANAGDQMTACATAFAAGCFSDVVPEDFDCNWQVAADDDLEPGAKDDERLRKQPAAQQRSQPAAGRQAEDSTELRTEELND